MRTYVAGHEPVTATEFAELALGTPLELWLGEDGETEIERAARLDAARDILADDPGLVDRVSRVVLEAIEEHASTLLNVTVLRPPARTAKRGSGVAA